MLRVGLTGGLGSGKTTVAAELRALGAHVIEADEVARNLMQPGAAVYQSIVEHFGPGVLRADSTLDRSLLADLAFRQNRLAELNRLVHPPVIAAQQQWAERIFAADPAAVAVVESALIFEADQQGSAPGWSRRFDRIILVTAPEAARITRYVDRIAQLPGAPARAEIEADARRRIAAQIPDSEKVPLADFVLRNEDLLDDLRREVARVYKELARESTERARNSQPSSQKR